eukprot:gene301-313_t
MAEVQEEIKREKEALLELERDQMKKERDEKRRLEEILAENQRLIEEKQRKDLEERQKLDAERLAAVQRRQDSEAEKRRREDQDRLERKLKEKRDREEGRFAATVTQYFKPSAERECRVLAWSRRVTSTHVPNGCNLIRAPLCGAQGRTPPQERTFPDMAYFKSCRIVENTLHGEGEVSVSRDEFRKSEPGSNFTIRLVVGYGAADDRSLPEPSRRVVRILIVPQWAPLGAARMHELVTRAYFDGLRFFRVIPRFMAQFGIPGEPKGQRTTTWPPIADDPVMGKNVRGTVTFATSGPNTRTNQLFINFGDNRFLDKQGFAPIGYVLSGMDVVDSLYSGYGEGGVGDGSDGRGPAQGRIQNQGNAYLDQYFPKLSFIQSIKFDDI